MEALVVSACVTATDPVLASAVVGKGKFAKRVPGHLRNLLSAESGCNDGMAFPFAYLALACIQHAGHPSDIAFHFIVITVLYECLFGTILGALIGYAGRHAIKYAERKNLIDRESFLVFYFVLAFLCTGIGSIIGTDDLLVSFAAGAAFSWDGWFAKKTEESHVSNVIDLLLNMSFFVYFGAIIPWDLYNSPSLGISPWKLSIIAILLILFRRIPILMALKPLIPDIRTWREALFCGHFGPIGVGAIFMSILARAELEHGEPTPLASLPSKDQPNYIVVAVIWPVVTFLIIASIIVHGSSVAVFALGKRLNNMTISINNTNMSQTAGSGGRWLQRLASMGGESKRTSISSDINDFEKAGKTTAKPAGGMERRRKHKHRVSKSTAEHIPENIPIDLNSDRRHAEKDRVDGLPDEAQIEDNLVPVPETEEEDVGIQAYKEGSNVVIEDSEGEVLETVSSNVPEKHDHALHPLPQVGARGKSPPPKPSSSSPEGSNRPHQHILEPVGPHSGQRVVAYQFDDHIIIENQEGEILRRYKLASANQESSSSGNFINRTLSLIGLKRGADPQSASGDVEKQDAVTSPELINVPTSIKHEDADKIDDARMKRQLKKYLLDKNKGKASAIVAPLSTVTDAENISPTATTPGVSGRVTNPRRPELGNEPASDDSGYNDSDDEETAIERERRLAALSNGTDEEDD